MTHCTTEESSSPQRADCCVWGHILVTLRPIIKLYIGPKNKIFHIQTENSVITQTWGETASRLSLADANGGQILICTIKLSVCSSTIPEPRHAQI